MQVPVGHAIVNGKIIPSDWLAIIWRPIFWRPIFQIRWLHMLLAALGFPFVSENRAMGLRAAAVLLITHYDRRHLDTIRKLVAVWAPPNENDTEAYARCVAEESGFGIDEPLDLHDYRCLKLILVAPKGAGGGHLAALHRPRLLQRALRRLVVPYLDAAKRGPLAVTLIGIGVMLWARIDDRRKGLR